MHTIVKEFKLHKFIGEKSKLPDHSAITCDFNVCDSDAKKVNIAKTLFNFIASRSI